MRNAYNILVETFQAKRTFGKRKHRCENNIKWILEKQSVKKLNGLNWRKVESNGRILQTR
jgi:hypothetical protein